MSKLISIFFLVFASLAFSSTEDQRQEAEIKKQIQLEQKYERKLGKNIVEQAKKLGLIDLNRFSGVEIKNNPFAHPAFLWLLGKIKQNGFKLWRVTEAYPVTARHTSKSHFNGRAIDLTVKDPSQAKAVCDYINSQEDYRCVNEYEMKFKTTTGKHLHITYEGI